MTCKLNKGALNHILLCFLFIVIFAYIVITINDKCSRENFLVDSLTNATSLDDFYGKKDRVLDILKNHKNTPWNSGEGHEASDLGHSPDLDGVDAELRKQIINYEDFNNQPTYQSNYQGGNISDSEKQVMQQNWNSVNQAMNSQQSSQNTNSGNPLNNNGTNSRDITITQQEQKSFKKPEETEVDNISEKPQRKTVIVNNHYYGSNKEVNDFIKELKEQKNNDENQFMLDMGQCGQLNNDLSSTKLADYQNARLRQEVTEQKCRKAGYGKAKFSPSQSQTALIGTLLGDARDTKFGSIITHDPMRKKIKYERLANMDAREGISAN